MANWAEGTLKIRGSKENVLKFLQEGLSVITYQNSEPIEEAPKFEIDELTAELETNNHIYIKEVHRAFVENTFIRFWFLEEGESELELHIKQAWSIVSEDFLKIAKKYDLNFKIFAFEKGMEFTQEIEILNGKITRDDKKYHTDYFWEVPFANIGG